MPKLRNPWIHELLKRRKEDEVVFDQERSDLLLCLRKNVALQLRMDKVFPARKQGILALKERTKHQRRPRMMEKVKQKPSPQLVPNMIGDSKANEA